MPVSGSDATPLTVKAADAVTTLAGLVAVEGLVYWAVIVVAPCDSGVTAPVVRFTVATAWLLENHWTELVSDNCRPLPLVPIATNGFVGTYVEGFNGNVTVCVAGTMARDTIWFGVDPVTANVAEAVTAL